MCFSFCSKVGLAGGAGTLIKIGTLESSSASPQAPDTTTFWPLAPYATQSLNPGKLSTALDSKDHLCGEL